MTPVGGRGHDWEPPWPGFVGLIAAAMSLASVASVRAVVTSGTPQAQVEATAQSENRGLPQARGAQILASHGCLECHSLDPADPGSVAPSLATAARSASERLADDAYTGAADTPEGYLRESIADHCKYVVAGYSCGDVPEYGLQLGFADLEAVAGFLMALPGTQPGVPSRPTPEP